ncbi:hypothetical protein GSI_09781 [Ganoderma sinense ZZ0214-1]|uniref:Uncharacterized protein n=1 Tax=Ganoderma sinense ZZ0214-1 TaxID=1077348 RepID=A0A2G8S2Y0_9APHY|nr:hypothetical protein GSI_09781 [Ganoderma sinense ZZ0214-1]
MNDSRTPWTSRTPDINSTEAAANIYRGTATPRTHPPVRLLQAAQAVTEVGAEWECRCGCKRGQTWRNECQCGAKSAGARKSASGRTSAGGGRTRSASGGA